MSRQMVPMAISGPLLPATGEGRFLTPALAAAQRFAPPATGANDREVPLGTVPGVPFLARRRIAGGGPWGDQWRAPTLDT